MSTSDDTGSRRRWVAIGVLVLAAAAGFTFMTRRGAAPPPEQASSGAKATDGTVTLADAALREAGIAVGAARAVRRRDQLEAPGIIAIDERRTARIGSMVDGTIVEDIAGIGDRVSAGTVLANMHSQVVHEAWAAYRRAVSDRRRLESDLQVAVQADERAARLLADKALPEQEVQRVHAARIGAEEALNVARTEVRRAEENLEHLGITNKEDPTGESGEQIPVRSPLTGVVLEKSITQGTAVTTGMPLFVVSDLSGLWALAEIDETALPQVKTGLPVAVSVSAYPDERFAGTITFVGDTVNPKTRRVTVRCQVPNPQGRLKPEMYATVLLGEGEPREIVVVPSQAVQEIEGRTVVFIESQPGHYVRREITVGSDVDGWMEVRTGLRAGERVVTAGAFLLKSEMLKQTTPEG